MLVKEKEKQYFKCLNFKRLLLSRNYSRLNNMFGNEGRSFVDEYKYFSNHRMKFYNEMHKKIKNHLLEEEDEIEESSSDEDGDKVESNENINLDSFFLEYVDIESSDEEIEEILDYEENESLIEEETLSKIFYKKEEGEEEEEEAEEITENDLTVEHLETDLEITMKEVNEFVEELGDSEDEENILDELSNPFAFYLASPTKHKDFLIDTYTKAILDKTIYNSFTDPLLYNLIKEIPFEPENKYLNKYLNNNLTAKDKESFNSMFNNFYFKKMDIFGIETEDKSAKLDLVFYEQFVMFKIDNQLVLYGDDEFVTPKFLIYLINLKFQYIIETDEKVYDFYEVPYDFYEQLHSDLTKNEKAEIERNQPIPFKQFDYDIIVFINLINYGLENNLFNNSLLKKTYNFFFKLKPALSKKKSKKIEYKIYSMDYIKTQVYTLKKEKPLKILNIKNILEDFELEEILVDEYEIKENFYFHYTLSFELFNFINILFFLENPDFNLNNYLSINLKENKQVLYLISELYLLENFISYDADDFEEFLNQITSNPVELLNYIYSFMPFEMELFKQYLLYFRKHFYYILKHIKWFKYELFKNSYYYPLIDYRIKSNVININEDLTFLKMFMLEVYINPLKKELKNYNEKIYEVTDKMSDMLYFNPKLEQYDLEFVFQYKYKVVLLASHNLTKFELMKNVAIEAFKSKWKYSLEYCKENFLLLFKNMKNIARRTEMFSDFIIILINYLKENDLVKYYYNLYKKEIEKDYEVEEILNQIKMQETKYLQQLEDEEKRLALLKEERRKMELKIASKTPLRKPQKELLKNIKDDGISD